MRSIFHVDLNSFYASCEIIASRGRYNYDSKIVVTGNSSLYTKCDISVVYFLASSLSDYVTGATIDVNGGLLMR